MKDINVMQVAKSFKDKPIFPDNAEMFLRKIMEAFGEENMQFTCEKEFQFELAWAMRQVFDALNLKDHNIFFESLAKQDDATDAKRDYFDLAVQYGEKAVLIELKYKKAAQRAHPWNAYLFLHDVERLESFVGKTVSQEKFGKVTIERGYAILLTDSKYYYEIDKHSKVWKQFLIYNNAQRHGDLTTMESKRTYDPIHLDGNYVCKWENYHEPKRYLLLEVNKHA